MPHPSQKECTRRELWARYLRNASRYSFHHHATRRLLQLHEGFMQQRYMYPRLPVPKSNWTNHILPQYSEDCWRTVTRMEPQSFKYILALLKDNPIFYHKSTSRQAPVDQQLKLALYKLANDGSASGFRHSSNYWGASEGHINNSTRRVIYALFQLQDSYIKWPTENEKRSENMRNQDREGFLGAIGKVDGTDIVLKYKPGGVFHGEHFYTRKKRYSIDLCAVCDSQKRFIYSLTGFSNTTHDSRV